MIYVYNCILNQCYYICFYGQKLTTFHTTMTINHHIGAIKVGGQDGMRLASGCLITIRHLEMIPQDTAYKFLVNENF